MNKTVRELRTQAQDSTYSTDREEAIEKLGELYSQVDDTDREAIGRTLVEIATDATYSDERELAQATLNDLFHVSAAGINDFVITAYCRLARDGNRSSEREQALDRLQRYQSEGLSEELLDRLRETYLAIIDDATHKSERRRARDALASLEEVDAAEGETASENETTGDAYLAVSLAEHLDEARHDSPTACRKRLDELCSYVEQFPVDDDAYDAVKEDLTEQARQLEAIAEATDTLDDARRDRIGRLADRVRRLYLRAERA